jgi:hypothetical protein
MSCEVAQAAFVVVLSVIYVELFDFPYLKLGVHVMKAYQVYVWMVGAAVVLLAGSSASEAGWFRGGGRCYHYPAQSTYSAATNPAATATTQAASPTPAEPVVHQANKPVNGPEPMPTAPPAAANYPPAHAPSTTSGAGGSVTPRSSWDYGRLPPYR